MDIIQRDVSGSRSITSTSHLFNGAVIDRFSSKQSKTSRSSSNTETRAIYTVVLDKKYIINFYRSVVNPIGPPSKLYEDNQATIKIFLLE